MTDRQLKRYLKNHPDLTDGLLVVSISEASEMLRLSPMPSFEEMIETTKRRFPQYSSEQWAVFDRVIDRSKQKSTRWHWNKQLILDKARIHKLAIASFVAAVILFFTLIPAGRALAQEIYHYIVNVIGNLATITQIAPEVHSNSSQDILPDYQETGSNEKAGYSSLEDFRSQTGLEPFELHATWLTIESISGDYSPEFGQTLWTNYLDNDGNEIRLSQEWFTGQKMFVQTDDDAFESIEIRDHLVLYYGIDPNDNNFGGFIMLDGSFLFIGADSSIDIEKLLDALG